MHSQRRIITLITILAAAHAAGATPDKAPQYILNGYTFSGLPGVNTDELAAHFKHHAGDHITAADITDAGAALTRELQARHISGRVFTTMAERHGRVWIILDVLHPPAANTAGKHLASQNFEGASHISISTLSAATGLKPGDALTPQNILAARTALLAAYEKAMPGAAVKIKGKLQSRADGAARLTWIIDEPK